MSDKLQTSGFDLYSFQDPFTLLEAYSKAKKAGNKNWSVSRWARVLRLESASSLFMVLHRKRRIGAALEEKLSQYFRFNQAERDYFRVLIRSSAVQADPVLGQLAQKRIKELQKPQTQGESELIRMRNGKMLTLMGEVDPAKAASLLLSGTQLEPFQLLGRGVLTVTCTHYGESSLGMYSEAHFSLIARSSHSVWSQLGLQFFGAVITRPDVRDYLGGEFEIPYIAGDIDFLEFRPECAQTRVTQGPQSFFEMSMGKRVMEAPVPSSHERIMVYTEKLADRRPYVLELNSKQYRRKFDASVDSFAVNKSHAMSQLLQELEFIPMSWTFHDELVSRIFEPGL